MLSVLRILGVVAICGLFVVPTALASEDHLPPSISVSSTGRTFAKPNLAIVNVGVVTRGNTAAIALKSNNSAMSALTATIEARGIGERDTQTSNFCVSPEYQSTSSGRSKIVGYSVSNSLQIKVRKLAALGEVLDAVVQSGANQVNGISFVVEDVSKLLDIARKEAMADARRKAQLYADAAGIQLGKVLYVVESGSASPPMVPRNFAIRTMNAMAEDASVPISSGEEELVVQTTVTFAI